MKANLFRLGILVFAASLVSVSAVVASPDLEGHYLAIQTALASDSMENVGAHAVAIERILNGAGDGQEGTCCAGTKSRKAGLAAAAGTLAGATDLQEARLAFGDLSEILVDSFELNPEGDVKVAYCSMAKKHWLQTGDKIFNPYYGSKMLRCGQFVPHAETTN
jgi:hypothetical protein